MRCTVGFFGVNRALPYTGDSIREMIYGPLEQAGVEVRRLAHFNCPALVHSPISGEVAVAVDLHDTAALELDRVCNEFQLDEVMAGKTDEFVDVPWRAHPDPGWHWRRNHLWQLYSLSRLYQMIIDDESVEADFYLILRSDLLYKNRLPVQHIRRALDRGAELLTPRWHRQYGLNDRFAVCRRSALAPYCLRQEDLPAMVRKHGYMHSETLLFFSARAAGLQLGNLPMRAQRVRATGAVVKEDFGYSIVHEWLGRRAKRVKIALGLSNTFTIEL